MYNLLLYKSLFQQLKMYSYYFIFLGGGYFSARKLGRGPLIYLRKRPLKLNTALVALSVQKTTTHGVLDSCHWLARGYRLRPIIVSFPNVFNRKETKVKDQNRRRMLGCIIRLMDTYRQTDTEASFSWRWKGRGDQSFVMISFLTVTLEPHISRRTRCPSSITLVPTSINTWSLLLPMKGCTKAPSHNTRIALLSLHDSQHYDVC